MRPITKKEEVGMIPSSVYKYRNFEDSFHKRILTDREIYFSKTNQINDPFDCKIPFRVKNYTGSEYLQICLYLAKLVYPNEINEFYYKWAMEAVDKDLLNDPVHLEKERQSLYKEINLNYSVFCSTEYWDNIILWSHYANSHTGFCVELDNVKLREYFPLLSGPINYQDEFPFWDFIDSDPPSTYVKMLATKYTKWKYEDEYRHISMKLIGKAATLPPDCFLSLTLGVNVKDSDRKWAVRKFKGINQNLPVYKVELCKNKEFSIERHLLE